jgi:hypothetical protein
MIIKDQTNAVETIGNITEESQFKIKVSPKAFQILSSLYSDKPLAIVRELGCNAMDSHIASGQPNRPLHVHVPNTLEPWLTIQDFGLGISHQDIYRIYTEYFNSTKTNTNDQVGMLGLGSKSPFCYTDAFTITSIHEGIKRIYNAYFNQQGVPTISLASQGNTTDHNGVAIQIPVKQSDMGAFYQAIFKAFRFFDVKPDITGGDIQWDTDKADFEGSFWKSFTKLNQSYAIMGGVTYPIDTYKVANEHYDIARKAGLVIKFNVGELDVTPSRESLMYHDWVLEAINKKFELVKKDFVSIVENTITNSDNLLDAMKALYMLKEKWSFLNSSMINGKVFWKKIEITEPRKSVKNCAPLIRSFSKRLYGRSKYSESEYAQFHAGSVWYYDNLKKGSIKRIISFVRNHADANIAINLISEHEMKNLIKAGFPASIFNPTSTLPSVASTRASSGSRTSRPKGVITLYGIGYDYRTSWESESFDLATGTAPKYYIVKDTNGFIFNLGKIEGGDKKFGVNVEVTDKQTLKHFCSYAGIGIEDVRMVAKTNAQHLDALGSKNLQEVFDKKKKIDLDWEKIKQVRSLDLETHQKIVKHKLFAQLDATNPLKVFVDNISECVKEIQKLKHLAINLTYIERNSFTFQNPMIELIYLTCDTWQVGVDKAMKAAIELNTK